MRGTTEGIGCFPTGRHYPGIAHLLRIVVAGLAEEFAGDTSLGAMRLVCIDTETTGRDPEVDNIVEIGCVIWQAGEVVERKSWLVNPGRPIPKEASDVHGIKDEDVKDAPLFGAMVHEVLELAAGCVPVAYNAEYDRKMLAAEIARANVAPLKTPPCLRRGVEWIDPLVWARELQKSERSRSLSEVCERLGIALEGAHRAVNDAEA
ncbi:MAG TPA: 3'-5' exonuclease, partial [Polyangiaceae bacterium]|nr:3'-5' exonuclease [Polyangiaceae bacterium]